MFTTSQLHNFTALQPHSLRALQPHSLRASQPHNLVAEHKLWSRYLNQQNTPQKDEFFEHGCVSNPDSATVFRNSDQRQWLLFSEQIINHLLLMMADPSQNFQSIYEYCAQQRSKIALSLNHGGEQRRQEYGYFRYEAYESFEEFFLLDTPQAWKLQKAAVFKQVDKLIKSAPLMEEGRYQNDSMNISTLGFLCYELEILSTICPAVCAENSIRHYSSRLSTIYYLNRDRIVIRYAGINQYSIVGDWIIANIYYQDCLRWQGEGGMKELLIRLGRLSHLIAHLLPVKLGNAGIMGWIQRAIAFKMGIELGAYSQTDAWNGDIISWDFMALVTPDRETYAQWFAKNAFLTYMRTSSRQFFI